MPTNWGAILGDTVGGYAAGGPWGALAGAAVGVGTSMVQNQQYNQQQAAIGQQFTNQEALMQYNEKLNLDYWNQTNSSAQVSQLQAAGLNPALMYARGGPGGGSLGGGAPTAPTAQNQQPQGQMSAQTMAQLAEVSADVKLKTAQAENLAAQTPQEAPLMQANIDNLNAGVNNQQAQTALTDIKSQTERIANTIQGATIDDQIATIKATATNIETTAQQAVRNNWIDQQTMNDKIKIVHGTMIGTFLQNNQTQQQTTNSITQIAQQWANLNITQQNANTAQSQMQINQFVQNISNKDKTIIDALTKLISGIIRY